MGIMALFGIVSFCGIVAKFYLEGVVGYARAGSSPAFGTTIFSRVYVNRSFFLNGLFFVQGNILGNISEKHLQPINGV